MRILLLIITLFFLGLSPCLADQDNMFMQRIEFWQARLALQQGNYAKFLLLSHLLHDYPLYPYLVYADLTQHINSTSQAQIDIFLHTYADTPLAPKLRDVWLEHLAKQQNWPAFLHYYQPTENAAVQCGQIHAWFAMGDTTDATKNISKYWLVAYPQPSECQAVFTLWQKMGGLTPDLLWKRLQLAMADNNTAAVNQIMPFLTATQQAQVKLWQSVVANPALVNKPKLFNASDTNTRTILLDGITRLLKQNAEQAVQRWANLQKIYHFSVAEQQTVIREIAILLARNADPTAAYWLQLVTPAYADDAVRTWRVRTALAQENWSQVNYFLLQLSPADRATSMWRYWQARTLAAKGQTAAAQAVYAELAKHVNYYGLLASQQLKQPYHPVATNYVVSEQLINQVAALPGIVRAYELYNLHLLGDARSEWRWATRDMTNLQLIAAAQLAKRWNWYDRSIQTVLKTGDNTEINLRYPLADQTQIMAAAKQYSLDPAWIFAIIHQESSFMPDAKSDVGALGLMQIMPPTAKLLDKHMKVFQHNSQLLNIETNITLGSKYLQQLLVQSDNSMMVASAAYNAGPTRLKKWFVSYKQLPADVWVETLPFMETRDYVKSVLLATAIYQQQLKNK